MNPATPKQTWKTAMCSILATQFPGTKAQDLETLPEVSRWEARGIMKKFQMKGYLVQEDGEGFQVWLVDNGTERLQGIRAVIVSEGTMELSWFDER